MVAASCWLLVRSTHKSLRMLLALYSLPSNAPHKLQVTHWRKQVTTTTPPASPPPPPAPVHQNTASSGCGIRSKSKMRDKHQEQHSTQLKKQESRTGNICVYLYVTSHLSVRLTWFFWVSFKFSPLHPKVHADSIDEASLSLSLSLSLSDKEWN